MPAPKGNQFWKIRSKHGRDKLFKSPKLLMQAAIEYFEWCDKNPWIKKEQLKQPKVIKEKDGSQRVEAIADIPTARPYTLSGLCIYLGVHSTYFNEFKEGLKPKEGDKWSRKNKDFSQVVHAIEEIIRTQKYEGAAVGAFNASIIARDLGLTEKQDVTSGGKPIKSNRLEVEIVLPKEDDEE